MSGSNNSGQGPCYFVSQCSNSIYGNDANGMKEIKFTFHKYDGSTFDKEYEVAVEAVGLVTSILRYHPDVLSDADSEQVYRNNEKAPNLNHLRRFIYLPIFYSRICTGNLVIGYY